MEQIPPGAASPAKRSRLERVWAEIVDDYSLVVPRIAGAEAEAPVRKYAQPPEVELPIFWRIQTVFVYIVYLLNGLFQELCWLVAGVRTKSSSGALSWKVAFYRAHIYETCIDCFSRPVYSAPMDEIGVCEIGRPPRSLFARPKPLEEKSRRTCLNLASYNYLGFGGVDPQVTPFVEQALTECGLGAGAPHGSGSHPGAEIQAALERETAEFLDKPAAVCMGMGFSTNSRALAALLSPNTLVISDALNHKSIVEGVRASRAKVRAFKHNDMDDLEKLLEETAGKYDETVIVVEGIYSMEGDFCRLREVVALKQRFGARLYLDEAHSIGAVGGTGRGVTEVLNVPRSAVDVMMGTYTKSFGSNGGYLAADAETVAKLRASTPVKEQSALAPAVAAQALAALRALRDPAIGPAKIARLRQNTAIFRRGLEAAGAGVVGDSQSPVIPMLLLNTKSINRFSRYCYEQGVAVVVVGYPAVPVDGVRARFCMSASHDTEQVYRALQVVEGALDAGIVPRHHIPSSLRGRYEDALLRAPMPGVEEGAAPVVPAEPPAPLKVAPHDPLGLVGPGSPCVPAAVAALNTFGGGTCGPRGFYGTTVEHLALERDLRETLGFADAIVYSHASALSSSVIPAVASRTDVIFFDEAAPYGIITGVQLSKARTVRFARHDAADLKRALAEHAEEQPDFKGKRYVVCEGLAHDGRLAPVRAYATVARRAGAQIIVDDSLGFGTVGVRGAADGVDVDLLIGSFETGLGGIGGFCAGRADLVEVQRLFGSGYCFSASAPVYAMSWARAALALAASPDGAARRARLAANREALLDALHQRGVAAHGDGYTVFLERTTPEARARLAELPGAEVRGETAVLLVSAAEDAQARAEAAVLAA